ncbi:nucleoside deaminase [Arthrobacter sp. H41]|uniref:nucleoside deaminase n=1 Tax=Arthrobacter sp. H41 TaxID=1312978 RepID=UPI0006768365|nr:nucleoside deaminase [Arthrobacter sp. H41]
MESGFQEVDRVASEVDLRHLRRCVALATEALESGDEPFGSILVSGDGRVLAEDRNRVASGDRTRHPEFELARWAAANLTPDERRAATVFTSGEHCPMCAAAHGWAGLGRIVYASSSEQLAGWLAEMGVPEPPVRTLPIRDIAPGLVVEGPVPGLAEQVRDLHRRFYTKPSPENVDLG